MKNFDTFGVMIDCSRNGVMNIPALKNYITILSKMGYNMVMLYTEDTYEVQNEPYFGYMRGRYTKEELRDLDGFAKKLGVELIPCIQTLAHVNAIFRWNEYSRNVKDIDDILLAGEDRTYELIENMFKSISEEFSSRKVHIGMDEAHNIGLGKYLDRHGFENRYNILMNHLKKVCEIARKYGFEPMLWDDMFFRICNHGNYSPVETFPDDIKNNIPENLSLVYWDYYNGDYQRYIDMFESTKKLSDKIWFAGGAWCWGGMTPHARNSIKRTRIAMKACLDENIKNVFITMWGDDGQETPQVAMLAGLMNAAAAAEGMTDEEMKKKFSEITGESYDAFIDLDLPNYIMGEDTEIGTYALSKNRLYNDPFIGLEDLNCPDGDDSLYAVYRDKLKKDSENSANFKYLFDTQAALCDVLSVKYSLGTRTRALYDAGDKEGLRKLAESDYVLCEKKVQKLYECFRTQWYTVNKSFGFEVLDVRFGGLINRLKNCARILSEYADGKLERIEELEQKQLPNDGPGTTRYMQIVTPNILSW